MLLGIGQQSALEGGVVGVDLCGRICFVEIILCDFLFLGKACFYGTSCFSEIFYGSRPGKVGRFSDGFALNDLGIVQNSPIGFFAFFPDQDAVLRMVYQVIILIT